MELGDVTGAFGESTELNRHGGKLFLRQPSGGLPGLHHQQLLETRLPLYGLNDSPKRWFLEVSKNIGWESSALDEYVFIFFDPESKVLTGILCLHVDDLLLGVLWHSLSSNNKCSTFTFSVSQMEKESRRILW